MSEGVKTAAGMIAGMRPQRQPGTFVFVTITAEDTRPEVVADALATFQELEGLSLILPVARARAHGFDVALPMCCITLTVHSALDGVGLTAAVASALAAHGIPCNMVAAFHHDHAFVSAQDGDKALDVLLALQSSSDQA
ncbi:MAG: ACT domain-containing protein [Roseobacter sp.]